MKFDPHSVLGVAQGAEPAELKRAYRRLAMRWHPDRNSAPEATERFKQIQAAYTQLATVDVVEMPETEEAEAPAEEAVAKAADIRLNLSISLAEAASGCRQTIHYARGKACGRCHGSGESGMGRTRFCASCHGSGRVRDAERNLVACEECAGRGFITERTCKDCGGSGRDTAQASLEISVPPGMLPGDELRLAGQGEPASDGLQAGDLYLTIVIHAHPLFALRGRNLHFSMPVSALALMAGGEIELPTLAGSLRHTLKAATPTAQELRLAGKGYPGRGKYPAGDLMVELTPVFPGQLNARQRKLLLQANAALMDDCVDALPEIAAWRQANDLA